MKKTLFLASIAAWIFNPVMASVTYSDFGMSFVDSANKVYYEGGGHFIVQSGGVTELDLTIDLDSFYCIAFFGLREECQLNEGNARISRRVSAESPRSTRHEKGHQMPAGGLSCFRWASVRLAD